MKFSYDCLNHSMSLIVENFYVLRSHFGNPTLLAMCASEIFMYPEKYKSLDQEEAIYVIRTALRELTTTGVLETGDADGWA